MRQLFTLLSALLMMHFSHAQFVDIPDPAFRDFLEQRYPACFNNAGQMDTTCSDILQEQTMGISELGVTSSSYIHNLEGLQYFKNLTSLGCSFVLFLDTIPAFPSSLKEFQCNNTALRTLPPLPAGLKKIYGQSNFSLTHLPALPDSLTRLEMYDCSLYSLPALPSSLLYLDCSKNRLSSLPVIPASLLELNFGWNAISSFPALPANLQRLRCNNNPLQTIPAFPPALEYLDCSFDELITLPEIISINTLQVVNCSYNRFGTLPALPGNLAQFNCSYNQLTALPALPGSLTQLNCSFNLLTHLPAMPAALTDLDFGWNSISGLPVLPNTLTSLKCNNNPLHTIPALPVSLQYLDCSNDSLSSLPAIPDNGAWTVLNCANNQLTSLPALPQIVTELFDCSGNSITRLERLTATRKFNGSYNEISFVGDFYGPSFLYLNHNRLTSLPDLKVVEYMNIMDNNITCLPKITPYFPWMDVNVHIDSSVKCNPNYDEHVIFNIGLPHCNPTNNVNQCQPFPVISGTVFYDNNNNNIRDAGEPYKRNAELHLSNGLTVHSSDGGSYQIGPDSIGTYTLTAVPPAYFNTNPANATYNFTSYDTMVTRDFALHAAVVADSLTVTVTSINWAARPGFSFPYMVNYENTGTTTLTPTIVFNYDPSKLVYDSCSSGNIIQNGTTLTLNIGSIAPGEAGSFVAYCTLRTTVPLGDSLWAKASIHANSFTAYDSALTIVRGAFDPNDKQATPQLSPAQVANGEYIDYTIRFQNTGTDTAFNVVISDTLSSMLQANTLQMIAASHNCKTTVKDNVVFFEFLNILLPDSNVNEPKSHGFVSFKIKPQTNVSVNSSINNKAAIYFDYNAPVITNTASTLIKEFITVPLKLVSFSAIPQNDNTTTLYWNTANEINSNYFVIESGTDGFHFNSVATIAAKGMANNTYNAKVADNNTGIVFYRLKMADKDGRFTYSPIIKTDRRKNTSGISILSNPVKDVLIISSSDASLNNSTALLINSTGAVVKRIVVKEGTQTIDIHSLPPGVYYIRSNNGSQKLLIR